jgi:hypothetical protein
MFLCRQAKSAAAKTRRALFLWQMSACQLSRQSNTTITAPDGSAMQRFCAGSILP